MNPLSTSPYRPGVLAAVLCLLVSATSVAAKNEGGKPLHETAEPTRCKSYESGSKGHSLRCPKWADPYRDPSTGLQVTYQIGDAAPKQAEVFEDATSWLVYIPEHLQAGDDVSVELSFRYKPSDVARQALAEQLRDFNETLVENITQTLSEHGKDWASKLIIDSNASAFALLNSARTKDDTPAVPALLEGLGFTQDKTSQKWKPTAETLKRLNAEAQKWAGLGLLDKDMLADTQKGAEACSKLLNEPPSTETLKELLARAARCFKKVSSEVASETAKAKAAVPANQAAQLDGSACQQHLSAVPSLDGLDETTPEQDIKKMSDELGQAQINGKTVCPKSTTDQLARVNDLLTLSRHVKATAQNEEALKARLSELVETLAITIGQPAPRNQLLSVDAERRSYSLSSGAVHLFGLDDLVYPIAVSVCPFGGCLRGDEQFWRAGNGFARSFSFEVGVAALTADTYSDARRRTGPGFLLGVSWQALAPFRVSGGTLFFENNETRRWQFDKYLGLTLDAVKAVEMMGLFGVTVPAQLKSMSKPSR